MKIKQINPAEVIPYKDNPRENDGAVAAVAESLEEFGFRQPIVVDENMVVIVGHTRLKAAIKLGMAKVPVHIAEGMTKDQARAYRIADNQTASLSEWNKDLLTSEVSALFDAGFDLGPLGFSDSELTGMLGLMGQEDYGDPEAIPDVPEEPTSKLGDVYILGNHRLVCGDSCVTETLDKLMGESKADLIFTDPPWNVNYGASNHPSWKTDGRKILNDHMDDDDWDKFVADFCASLFICSKPGAMIYLVMSAQEWPSIHKNLSMAGFHWSSTIIWAKDRMVLSRKDYHTQYEPIWYGWNASGPRISPLKDRKQTDLWQVDRPSVSELHPTTKPIDLIERAILNSSEQGDVVVDLFGGSGSTLIACELTGRASRLVELDPKYVDVIVQRWETYTGKNAELIREGGDSQ